MPDMVKYNLGDIMNNEFISMLKEINIDINEKQYNQFTKYFQTLVSWNAKMNLTAITEENDVFIKHFYDSLYPSSIVEFSNQSILDVGSGAGFPSIPLKIIFPDLKVTIIDALNKRITFLKALCEELEIDVELIHGRAEEFKRKNSFDIVTARAVANLQVLSELCIPFVKKDGVFLSLKGPRYKDEIKLCKNTFKILNSKLENTYEYKIAGDARAMIIVRKTRESSNRYPRIFSKIKSNPL